MCISNYYFSLNHGSRIKVHMHCLDLKTGGSQIRNPIPLKIRRVWGLLHAKSYVVAKHPPVGVARHFEEEVPAQMSSSSSDRGSKLRGPFLNSPRVASKRDVNLA
ncbi:hypothetical protein AVEN_190090-1 [Araneus ventricosus]|uniref:Uncharacterized protein n=1 Tax=Araneus ventricosus TaxID=182803 RepID=A0A4Y2HPR3_ARAVE|nr:hypothetical protein AVEN_190090-1 [Araneus ventricosus]